MYQRDFIMKMIEMIAELVAGILGLIKKGDFEKAAQSINEAHLNFLKHDATFFNQIPLNKLIETLISEHQFTPEHLEVLSDLFYAQAELFYKQGELKDSLSYYEKALFLSEYTTKTSKIFSFEKQARLTSIEERIIELS